MNTEMNVVKADPAGLVEYISTNLVKTPQEINITPVKGGGSLVLELRVNPEDIGTVIGKGGRIAKAIRTLLSSISAKKLVNEDGSVDSFKAINLEIIDE